MFVREPKALGGGTKASEGGTKVFDDETNGLSKRLLCVFALVFAPLRPLHPLNRPALALSHLER